MTAICGEYITFKHIKTRKVIVLEIEVPEENFQHVMETLGMPIGGDSKPVAIALLNQEPKPQQEGRKRSNVAWKYCQNYLFQKYCAESFAALSGRREVSEKTAEDYIYFQCNISSRSHLDTNEEAATKWERIREEFERWKQE